MKKIVLIVIAVILLTAGGFLFFSLNQKSRNEMHLRMTEISAETLAAIPTETPLPTETPVPTEITSPSSEDMPSPVSSDFTDTETEPETSEVSSTTVEQAELPEIDLTVYPDFSEETYSTSTETPIPDENSDTSVREVVYIPSDTDTVTPDMLENAAESLTIVIPPNVNHIDESILDGRQITIVSIPGSAAESFAKQWNLNFLDAPWLLTDLEQDEE